MQSVSLKFGLIQASDFRPGFAFKSDSPEDRNIYVIKAVTGGLRSVPIRNHGNMRVGHSAGRGLERSATLRACPPQTVLPYLAEVFEPRGDVFVKQRESKTPVLFTEGDTNPHFSPTQYRRNGDQLTLSNPRR